jgi:pimeloyl-ACP methyl ester carboxylesterase
MMTVRWNDGATIRFEAGGRGLEGRMHGPSPEEAGTIVLLHEGLGSIELWRTFPGDLAAATALGVFA